MLLGAPHSPLIPEKAALLLYTKSLLLEHVWNEAKARCELFQAWEGARTQRAATLEPHSPGWHPATAAVRP